MLLGLLVAPLAPRALAEGPEAGTAARRCMAALPKQALEACHVALEQGLRPAVATSVRRKLVAALVSAGRWAEAVALAREAARLMPDRPEERRRLGLALLFLDDDAAGAATEAQALLRAHPDDARAYGLLGLALNAQGQHPEAMAAFAEALRLDPDYFRERPAALAAQRASQDGQAWPRSVSAPTP